MKRPRVILITGLILLSTILHAQGQPKLELDIQDVKLNMTAEEASGEADVVYSPGDTVEYTIFVKNTGTASVSNPEIVDPIPEGLAYVANSATGDNCKIFFSINDGSQYSEWPIMVRIDNGQGTQIGQQARPDQVTHIKWIINDQIPAGTQKSLRFRAVVK